MKVLGIDYGRKKIGLAVGNSKTRLTEPFEVFRFEKEEKALGKVEEVAKAEEVEEVVVGVSESEMAEESKRFAKALKEKLEIPISLQDETMSTQMAQKLAIEAGIKRKKRKNMEDAYSAALILQRYLESKR